MYGQSEKKKRPEREKKESDEIPENANLIKRTCVTWRWANWVFLEKEWR